jgi:hypothetical protein
MVQDYRYLNEHTVKNNYLLPLIRQLSEKLQGAKLFTKMDLRWGYNNVRIKEGDEWKAAFTCHRGSFEPLVMYFGLCNSPATFQAMMNEIFADMEDVVVVYIDDLLIFTKTDNQEEHDRIVLEVLRRLEEHDLFVKPEKCSFRVKEVEFLGMTISAEGIKMNDDKVKAILEWPTPKTVRGVRSFLGLANFYRRFIKDYAQVARPLNDLTKKDQAFEWKESQQTAFETLKQRFTRGPHHGAAEARGADVVSGAIAVMGPPGVSPGEHLERAGHVQALYLIEEDHQHRAHMSQCDDARRWQQ